MKPLTHFKMRILPLLIAPALVALVSPTVVRANAVTDWNLIASNAIVVTGGQPPPVSALSFAMVQAAGTAEARQRHRAVGRERAAMPSPEHRDAPHRCAKRTHQRGLHRGLQRDQGGRITHEHDSHTRPDLCCDLLAGPCPRAL